MAEPLSLAASVFSVVSLAIQLADSLKKAYEFWESIEGGPSEVNHISAELRFLASLVGNIQQELQDNSQDSSHELLVKIALQNAKNEIDNLASIVIELSSSIAPGQKTRKRRWGKVKIALKESNITKLRRHIESAKTDLLLAQLSRVQHSILQFRGKIELITASFTNDARVDYSNEDRVSRRLLQYPNNQATNEEYLSQPSRNKPPRHQALTTTSINARLCRLTIRTTTTTPTLIRVSDNPEGGESMIQGKKTLTVVLMLRFFSCRRGFTWSTPDTFDFGSFNLIRERPDDSLIFQMCRNSDVEGVKKLILSHQASVFDVDKEGRTPLHYACRNGIYDLVPFLLSKGADAHLRSDLGLSPIHELDNVNWDFGINERQILAKILNPILAESDVDPFDHEDSRYGGWTTLCLDKGLPYETLHHILAEDILLVPVSRGLDFLLENLVALEDSDGDFDMCLVLLLRRYEGFMAEGHVWPFEYTLLQILLRSWVAYHLLGLSVMETQAKRKVIKCLEFTEDLTRTREAGTPFDILAAGAPKTIPQWLELVDKSPHDLAEYLKYEQEKHPNGLIDQGSSACCRELKVKFGNGQSVITAPVQNICNPLYDHLDPQYRCEENMKRERCIAQIDESLIDESGKPRITLPGAWDAPLRSNSELSLVVRIEDNLFGIVYPDNLLDTDFVIGGANWIKSNSENERLSDFESSG